VLPGDAWTQQIDVLSEVDNGACVPHKWPLLRAGFSGDFVVKDLVQPRCNFQCADPLQEDGAWFFVIPEQTAEGWQAILPEATTCERIEYYFTAVDSDANETQSTRRFVEPDADCAINASPVGPDFVGTAAGAGAVLVGFSLGSATLATGVGVGAGVGLSTAAIVGITAGAVGGTIVTYVAVKSPK